MRIVFFGTSDFAVPALDRLAAGHDVVGVFTQPDRRRGRGEVVTPTPVKAAALTRNLPVFAPEALRGDEAALGAFAAPAPDIGVVVSYGLFLPKEWLSVPRYGCLNLHGSLLPRYRGAAPVQRALMAGEAKTGVTVIRLTGTMDAGPILAAAETEIAPDETAGDLLARLARLGAPLLADSVTAVGEGRATEKLQNENEATFAPALKKEEGFIAWNRPARGIAARVRGLTPWPGACTFWTDRKGGRRRFLITKAHVGPGGGGTPGEIVALGEGISVATAEGILVLERVKPEGKREMSGAEFARGQGLTIGSCLT
ncbi:MAG: methionyl-tRNA formyltransferase [Planctomycetota bacterium]